MLSAIITSFLSWANDKLGKIKHLIKIIFKELEQFITLLFYYF